MSFRPFQATPIKLGKRYRRRQPVRRHKTTLTYLCAAAVIGAVVGVGSTALGEGGVTSMMAAVKPLAVSAGLMRARAPQDGDYWSRCNEARAAGTAPIYSSEPGYRDGLDGDADGIACEPYRGM